MEKKVKLLLENGLADLCKHIKSIKWTAEQSGSAVSALAEATAASVEEIEGVLDEKQDKPRAVEVALSVGGWVSTSERTYPYCYDIAVAGVTANDRAQITIAPESIEAAINCRLCPTSETLAGVIRLRANCPPETTITAEYEITEGRA